MLDNLFTPPAKLLAFGPRAAGVARQIPSAREESALFGEFRAILDLRAEIESHGG